MGSASVVFPESSVVMLPLEGSLRRAPRWGWRQRPESFAERFEDRVLFYDCFAAAEPGRVLLIGPPLLNLAKPMRQARFYALPSNVALTPHFSSSLSTMTTRLDGVPEGTTAIGLDFGGMRYELPIQPNFIARFRGRRVMFTMSKNNPAEWITAWARYHQRRHGTDAIVFFDNGSDYDRAYIADALAEVEGLKEVAIFSWPYAYGAIDNAVIFNPYWTQFLQVSSMGVVLRRVAREAEGVLNVDLDELVHTPQEKDIYEIATQSPQGLVSMQGQWVEAAVPDYAQHPFIHSDFVYRLKDEKARLCKARKWAIDPRREWFDDLKVHPYMHWIENRPGGSKYQADDLFFWHFKGINTNWKVSRARPQLPDEATMVLDPSLRTDLQQALIIPDDRQQQSLEPKS